GSTIRACGRHSQLAEVSGRRAAEWTAGPQCADGCAPCRGHPHPARSHGIAFGSAVPVNRRAPPGDRSSRCRMRATADALGNERSRNRGGDCGDQPDIRPRAIRNSQAAMSGQLSLNLKRLEAEAIAIMRETAAEFRKPVLLYLIGKDSSVNVDTTWKFRDMIAF